MIPGWMMSKPTYSRDVTARLRAGIRSMTETRRLHRIRHDFPGQYRPPGANPGAIIPAPRWGVRRDGAERGTAVHKALKCLASVAAAAAPHRAVRHGRWMPGWALCDGVPGAARPSLAASRH